MFRDSIDAVTTCVGYADFLRAVAPHNIVHFDKWVVVTSPEDRETQHVCREFRINCLVSQDVTRDGVFSKGRMIERALQQLSANTWVVHIDADVVLPGRFRDSLQRAHLKPESIYGCDRILVKGWDRWQKLLTSGWLRHPFNDHPHAVSLPDGCPLMARWVGPDGYVPIGFFQMWNRSGGGEEWGGSRTKPYPISHGTACRTDVQHGLQWDRRHRELIPELFVCHLESDGKHDRGANWHGRKTPRFGPPCHHHHHHNPPS